jgi:hypothetical protein
MPLPWHHGAVKKAATSKKPAAPPKKKKVSPAKPGPRADFGSPIDGFFAKQQPELRPILVELRRMVEKTAPEATSSIKWGMPFFEIDGKTLCALAAFKAHANLILPGRAETYADPDGLLEGEGKTGCHLKLRASDPLPRKAISGWLRVAAQRLRS